MYGPSSQLHFISKSLISSILFYINNMTRIPYKYPSNIHLFHGYRKSKKAKCYLSEIEADRWFV